jgi:hypothetical protein
MQPFLDDLTAIGHLRTLLVAIVRGRLETVAFPPY